MKHDTHMQAEIHTQRQVHKTHTYLHKNTYTHTTKHTNTHTYTASFAPKQHLHTQIQTRTIPTKKHRRSYLLEGAQLTANENFISVHDLLAAGSHELLQLRLLGCKCTHT